MAKPLRAVAPDERPVDAKSVKNVADAAQHGSHRDLLVAMRDRIAKAVSNPDCPPRDLASLTRRLQDIAKEIASLDAQQQDVNETADVGNETFDSSAI
ncbi:hypothetical protein [Gordonia paraffinivorans]|uniref:hypothetical protein n=1 Tax=Gordonia paraffinivorans TaxID=175628 RepID=UPI003FCC6F71